VALKECFRVPTQSNARAAPLRADPLVGKTSSLFRLLQSVEFTAERQYVSDAARQQIRVPFTIRLPL